MKMAVLFERMKIYLGTGVGFETLGQIDISRANNGTEQRIVE
jgi:hypothetical protein